MEVINIRVKEVRGGYEIGFANGRGPLLEGSEE